MAKTQKEMVSELYQAVVGIPDNPNDNGLIGDIEEIKKQVRSTNGTVKTNVVRLDHLEERTCRLEDSPLKLSKPQYIIGGSSLVTFLSLLVVAVGKILGWW